MSRPVVVLRPEPGNAATAARLAAAGLTPLCQPIFVAQPRAWAPPDPAKYDALLVTSAQAPRLAGEELRALASLPAVAVGKATAQACRGAGLTVALVGDTDAADAIARARAAGLARLLHLAGEDRTAATEAIDAVVVYASVQIAAPAIPDGAIVLLHSARAAIALAAADLPRARIALVAISPAVAAAAGPGWAEVRVAARPDDAAMVQAAWLIDQGAPHRG